MLATVVPGCDLPGVSLHGAGRQVYPIPARD
jgi:hypothetical protein